jgi:hypothetical protein
MTILAQKHSSTSAEIDLIYIMVAIILKDKNKWEWKNIKEIRCMIKVLNNLMLYKASCWQLEECGTNDRLKEGFYQNLYLCVLDNM